MSDFINRPPLEVLSAADGERRRYWSDDDGFVAIDAECDLGGLPRDRLDDLEAFNRQTPSRIVVSDAGQDIFGDFWGVNARSRGDL